jgi:uncharacterized protein YecT (DUF1311 family)
MPSHFHKFALVGLIAGLSLTSLFTYAEEKHPIDARNQACLEKNQATTGMLKCMAEVEKQWDADLNQVYEALRSKLNTKAKQQLETAQQQWLKYRNAEFETIKAIYGTRDGRIWPIVAASARAEVVKQRVLILTNYLEELNSKE